jgi:uncharacterized protein YcbK (DUF882 family)
MRLTENFNLDEFHCKDGTPVPNELIPNVLELCKNLQALRDRIYVVIDVISGYRTVPYNKKVGGRKYSQHLKTKAADIVTRKYTPQQLADIIETLISNGEMKEGGIGIYPSFVHYDIRGERARWYEI